MLWSEVYNPSNRTPSVCLRVSRAIFVCLASPNYNYSNHIVCQSNTSICTSEVYLSVINLAVQQSFIQRVEYIVCEAAKGVGLHADIGPTSLYQAG
jgi:hypothetical protein